MVVVLRVGDRVETAFFFFFLSFFLGGGGNDAELRVGVGCVYKHKFDALSRGLGLHRFFHFCGDDAGGGWKGRRQQQLSKLFNSLKTPKVL